MSAAISDRASYADFIAAQVKVRGGLAIASTADAPGTEIQSADTPADHRHTSVLAQTLSFLAYIIRTYPNVIRRHTPPIPTFVLQLMQNCSAEASSTRKVRAPFLPCVHAPAPPRAATSDRWCFANQRRSPRIPPSRLLRPSAARDGRG